MATTCTPELFYNLHFNSRNSRNKISLRNQPESSSLQNSYRSGEVESCMICLDDLPKEVFVNFNCTHSMCYPCLKTYLKSRLEKRRNSTNNCSRSKDPPCPYCKKVITVKSKPTDGNSQITENISTPEALAEYKKLHKKATNKLNHFNRNMSRNEEIKYYHYLRYCKWTYFSPETSNLNIYLNWPTNSNHKIPCIKLQVSKKPSIEPHSSITIFKMQIKTVKLKMQAYKKKFN